MTRAYTVAREGKRSRRGRKKQMVKCSSCKIMKPSRDFKPIIVNGKRVIPKTCQLCRSRRTEYYWKYECKDARERGIRPPSKHHSTSLPICQEVTHEETELERPPNNVDSVDSSHFSDEESSTLSSTLSSGDVQMDAGDDSAIGAYPNQPSNNAADDGDDFILASDDILDEFQQVVLGKGETQRSDSLYPLSNCDPYALSVQEDPMDSFQSDVCSPGWGPSLFSYGNAVQDDDSPFTSFSIPFGDYSVY